MHTPNIWSFWKCAPSISLFQRVFHGPRLTNTVVLRAHGPWTQIYSAQFQLTRARVVFTDRARGPWTVLIWIALHCRGHQSRTLQLGTVARIPVASAEWRVGYCTCAVEGARPQSLKNTVMRKATQGTWWRLRNHWYSSRKHDDVITKRLTRGGYRGRTAIGPISLSG